MIKDGEIFLSGDFPVEPFVFCSGFATMIYCYCMNYFMNF